MRKVNKRLTGGRRWEQVLPTSELQRSSARDGVYNAGPVMESFSSDTVAKVRIRLQERRGYSHRIVN
jgi:hypothetical protein